MRGLSLINVGMLILLAALVMVFVYPANNPDPAKNPDPAATVQHGTETSDHPSDHAVPSDQATDHAFQVNPGPAVSEKTPLKEVAETVKGAPAVVKSADDSAATPSDTTTTDSVAASGKKSPVEPLKFPHWPKPRLSLIVTGEQLGYFEPCGCTANQLGGMSRRADLFKKVSGLGWEVRGIDAGSVSRRSVRQAQIKFETMLTAMRELKYVSIGMGPEELRLDPSYLISQHAADEPDSLAFVSANLTFFGIADLGTPLPYRIVEHDGLKIGITSILGATRKKEVLPERSPEEEAAADIQWLDPITSLESVLKKFEEENVTFRILLSQALIDETRSLAEKFPSFDLIVTAPSFGDGNREPEMAGSVRILQVGAQGKHAGVVGIYPDDAENRVRFELVTMSADHFQSSPRMAELMQSYQTRLKEDKIALVENAIVHPSGATFVGADKCGECHTTAFEIWKNTPHAHGFESLDPAHQRTGYERLEGVSRTHDPECLSCHVTGWDPQEFVRFQTGFINEEFAATPEEKSLHTLLAGNQCENCHGPGSRHIELIEAGKDKEAAAEVRVTLEQSKKEGCVKCHDGENSPKFSFDEYWKKVEHYGKD